MHKRKHLKHQKCTDHFFDPLYWEPAMCRAFLADLGLNDDFPARMRAETSISGNWRVDGRQAVAAHLQQISSTQGSNKLAAIERGDRRAYESFYSRKPKKTKTKAGVKVGVSKSKVSPKSLQTKLPYTSSPGKSKPKSSKSAGGLKPSNKNNASHKPGGASMFSPSIAAQPSVTVAMPAKTQTKTDMLMQAASCLEIVGRQIPEGNSEMRNQHLASLASILEQVQAQVASTTDESDASSSS